MRATHAPGTQEDRFAAYMNSLAQAAEHADREEPLKAYCKGLLLPGERKSVEPMAARLAPDNVRQMHQSLHHVVADSPWDDELVLSRVRQSVLPWRRTERSKPGLSTTRALPRRVRTLSASPGNT